MLVQGLGEDRFYWCYERSVESGSCAFCWGRQGVSFPSDKKGRVCSTLYNYSYVLFGLGLACLNTELLLAYSPKTKETKDVLLSFVQFLYLARIFMERR